MKILDYQLIQQITSRPSYELISFIDSMTSEEAESLLELIKNKEFDKNRKRFLISHIEDRYFK